MGEETPSYHQAAQLRLEEDQAGLSILQSWWHEGGSRMIHELAGAQDESEVCVNFPGDTDVVLLRQLVRKLGFLIHTYPYIDTFQSMTIFFVIDHGQ